MKKLLISILIVLLVILAYFAIFEGLSIGKISILGVGEIKEANDTLTYSIEQASTLLKKDFPEEEERLSTSITEELQKKEEYFNLAKKSTEGEITKANTEESYEIEFLWTKIGRQATSKGVNIEMVEKSGMTNEPNMKDLSFSVEGQYVGIIQFISALENNAELKFKIENFKMVSGGSNLTATFDVRNVRVKPEQVTTNPINEADLTNTDEMNNTQNANDLAGQNE